MAELATAQFTAAVSNTVQGTAKTITGKSRLDLVAKCTVVGPDSPPGTITAYVQTTVDGGTTWYDIAAFEFQASGQKYLSCDGTEGVSAAAALNTAALTADTAIDGLVGAEIRYVLNVTGSWGSGTQLAIHYQAH